MRQQNESGQPENDSEGIEGERSIPTVAKGQTLQGKINSVLGVALMVCLAFAFLYFYWTSLSTKKETNAKKAEEELQAKLRGDGTLPPLGAVPFPVPAQTAPPPLSEPTSIGDLFPPPPPMQQNTMAQYGNGTQKPKTPEELAEERRMTCKAFTSINQAASPSENNTTAPGAQTTIASNGQFASYLTPTATPAVSAQMLPSVTYLIPKGAKGDCTLETAISTQLPGMVTCVLALDIYGSNGKAVMLERGTVLTGETRGTLQQGQSRVFILWTQARTPKGVVAQLDSPATDSLGRSGLEGDVDNHFWERFGAAILVSVLNGVTQAASSYASGAGTDGGTSINYNPQSANSVMGDILRNTINIPPTVNVRQGERVQILFARDVDFRPVYALADKYQYANYQQ